MHENNSTMLTDISSHVIILNIKHIPLEIPLSDRAGGCAFISKLSSFSIHCCLLACVCGLISEHQTLQQVKAERECVMLGLIDNGSQRYCNVVSCTCNSTQFRPHIHWAFSDIW